MQRLRILVILILLSLMPLYSLAVLNEGQYAFRSLDINNGLSQNTVHAILQDKQGFMWFGTKDGLDRYDGISFRTFMKESGTLGNNFITSLYEDNLGQIWIGTDVGLYVYCPQMEKVRHFTLISNSNIDIDCTVNLITGDQKGGIWVVTQTRGIFYYNPQVDVSVFDQSGCASPHNLYIEKGGIVTPERFCEILAEAFPKTEAQIPKPFISPEQISAVHSSRGVYDFKGRVWGSDTMSWTVLYSEDNELCKPVYSRVLMVHPVDHINDALVHVQDYIQTIGIAALEDKAIDFANKATMAGVARCPLIGRMLNFEMPWDGLFLIDRLVRWNTLGGPLC